MILRAEGITKKFFRMSEDRNYFYALEKTDLQLEPGKLTEIFGRSGSGKTTLLNILAGLLSPSEGNVYLDDTELYSLPDRQLSLLRNRHMGVVPQGQTGLDSLTVLENVQLPYLLCHKKTDETAVKRAKELLTMVGLEPLAEAYPKELSGGEGRRLSIARALMNRPEIVLADEPTGDLDDENTTVILKLLRSIADEGCAVLMVTHEAEAKAYGDRIYRMDAGILKSVEQ